MQTKQSWVERIKKRNRLGFSLVELIVIIAMMAVLIAVLAPSLLGYVERSRAQKDMSAMDEVTNAVFLSMADPYVYDELVQKSIKQNVSCYIDTNSESVQDANRKHITKDKVNNSDFAQYIFDDNSRLEDETKFYFAGNMRGTTITFEPDTNSNKSTYVISDGVINKPLSDGSTKASDLPHLYNAIRQAVGDRIQLSSQTYRNSEYTIFIRIGTTGGNQANAQDAMAAYGQFSGTNLPLGGQRYSVAYGRVVADPDEGVNDEEEEVQVQQLSTPTIAINGTVLSITPVTNATEYKVFNGNAQIATTAGADVDLATYLTTAGTYTIKVQAVGSAEYKASEYATIQYTVVENKQNGLVFERPYVMAMQPNKMSVVIHNDGTYNTYVDGVEVPKESLGFVGNAVYDAVNKTISVTMLDGEGNETAETWQVSDDGTQIIMGVDGGLKYGLVLESNSSNIQFGQKYEIYLDGDTSYVVFYQDGSIDEIVGDTTTNVKGAVVYGESIIGYGACVGAVSNDGTQITFASGMFEGVLVQGGFNEQQNNGTYYEGVTSTTLGNYAGATNTHTNSSNFPSAPSTGDVYVCGDYEYRYNMVWDGSKWTTFAEFNSYLTSEAGLSYDLDEGWGVRVRSNSKTSYGVILDSICGKPVNNLVSTFNMCTSMTAAPTLPSGVTYLINTFSVCLQMSDARIPSGVTTIGYGAFAFTRITNISIPIGVTSIDKLAFTGCSSIQSFFIPKNVASIAPYSLSGLASLEGFTIDASNPYYNVVDGVIYTEDMKTLMLCPSGKTGETFTIPSHVTTIGECAFDACDFTNIYIPDSVIVIEDDAFADCENLISITIPDSVVAIGTTAFSSCGSLKTVVIGKSVETMDNSFYMCDYIERVYYTGSEEDWNQISGTPGWPAGIEVICNYNP